MKILKNSLQALGVFAGKQETILPAVSGFVYPLQKHKILFSMFLHRGLLYEADKAGQWNFICPKLSFVCLKSSVYQSFTNQTKGLLLQSVKFIK